MVASYMDRSQFHHNSNCRQLEEGQNSSANSYCPGYIYELAARHCLLKHFGKKNNLGGKKEFSGAHKARSKISKVESDWYFIYHLLWCRVVLCPTSSNSASICLYELQKSTLKNIYENLCSMNSSLNNTVLIYRFNYPTLKGSFSAER